MIILESLIYTKFTDSPEIVKDSFEAYFPDSGHVITTMSAGWPLFFLNLGASFCTVIDRNSAQIDFVLKKFEHTPEFRGLLEYSCNIINADFTLISPNFWNGLIFGDEFIFLSNIWDHCVTEGKDQLYVNQIKAIIESANNLTRITLLSSSFSQKELGNLEVQLRNSLGRNYRIVCKQLKAGVFSKSPLKDFRLFEISC